MVVAGVLALYASASARTFPGANGRIAYVANNQVFTMAANGGGVRQLTHQPRAGRVNRQEEVGRGTHVGAERERPRVAAAAADGD